MEKKNYYREKKEKLAREFASLRQDLEKANYQVSIMRREVNVMVGERCNGVFTCNVRNFNYADVEHLIAFKIANYKSSTSVYLYDEKLLERLKEIHPIVVSAYRLYKLNKLGL